MDCNGRWVRRVVMVWLREVMVTGSEASWVVWREMDSYPAF